ncbi:MAG: PAS domain S-box protein [Phycisphaerae bacterium]|jgi:PAS domain S-box-containing protein
MSKEKRKKNKTSLTVKQQAVADADARFYCDNSGIERLDKNYTAVFENVTEGVSIVDIETKRFIHANSVLCQMLGYSPEELIGRPITEIHPKQEQPFLGLGFEAMARGEITYASRISFLAKDGKIIHADISSTRLKINRKTYLMGFFTDISKLKTEQHVLNHSEKCLEMILDQSFDGINICQYNPKTHKRQLVLCNDRYVQMTGRTREELMAMDDLNKIVIFYGSQQDGKRCQQFIKEQKPHQGRCSWIRPDGKENYYDWVAKPVKIDDRYFVVGIDRDITEYVKAEEELKETEVKYQTLIEQIPAVTYTAALDKASTTQYISP